MKSKVLIILLISLLSVPCTLNARSSENKRHLGLKIEWGYTQSFFHYHRYGVTSIEGYRIYETAHGIKFNPNGRVLLGARYEYNNHFELGLTTGYLGAQESIRAIPIIAQIKYYPVDIRHDGFFTQIEAGAALHISKAHGSRLLPTATIGEGYRLMLSPEHSIDLIISLSNFYDKPNIANPDGAGYIPRERILSNHAIYSAVNICICLNF